MIFIYSLDKLQLAEILSYKARSSYFKCLDNKDMGIDLHSHFVASLNVVLVNLLDNYKEPQCALKTKDANGVHKPMDSWSTEEVGDWLGQIDLGQYRDNFVSNAIDGTELCNMNDKMLIDLGVGMYCINSFLTTSLLSEIHVMSLFLFYFFFFSL